MADFNQSTSERHQTINTTTTTTGQSGQTTTPHNSQNHRSDGIHRTESGRETYYPDGHETRVGDGVRALHCEHGDHTATPSSPVTRASYGLYPTTESRTQQSSSTSRNASGGGLFGGSSARSEQIQTDHTQRTEEVVPLEKVESSSSSSSGSSTRYGSAGEKPKRRESSMLDRPSTEERHGSMLQRRATRSEIDDEGRRELARIFTTQSQKITQQMSLAQPGDPTVDPSSDSFDLQKFLNMFRHQMEGEGVEVKKLNVVYKNLNVFGSGKALQLQKTVGDIPMMPFRLGEMFGKSDRKQILHDFNGIIRAGELCVVLGRPGSGCSTLLKALTGELHGLDTDESTIHYNGISQKRMMKEFKGEMVYNQEVDKHFPHLTVGQTLEHAAALRTPSNRPMGVPRGEFSGFLTQVVMAVLGLSHTYNTKVGNDFVRGVSGGERKRVSVAEMMLAGSPLAAWDNSTRGLDSATALKFVKVCSHIVRCYDNAN